MVSWGGTRRDLYTNRSYDEACDICEDYNWQFSPDGGYVWDLELAEM
jgi:hypothetical protein